MKQLNLDGKVNYANRKGTHLSEEHKQQLSDLKKSTGIGEANSQYGTCWITMNGINKKVNKEDLETYLNEGWVKGRKLKK